MGGAFKPQATESDRTATADYFSQVISQALQGKIDLPGLLQNTFTQPQYPGPLGAGITQSQSDYLNQQNQVLANYFGGRYNIGGGGIPGGSWGNFPQVPSPTPPRQPTNPPQFFPGFPGGGGGGGGGGQPGQGSGFYPPNFPQTGIPITGPQGSANYPLPQPVRPGPVLTLPGAQLDSGMLTAFANQYQSPTESSQPSYSPEQIQALVSEWTQRTGDPLQGQLVAGQILAQTTGDTSLLSQFDQNNQADRQARIQQILSDPNTSSVVRQMVSDPSYGLAVTDYQRNSRPSQSGMPSYVPPAAFSQGGGGANIPNTGNIPIAGNPNPSGGQFGMNPGFIRSAPDRTFDISGFGGGGGNPSLQGLGAFAPGQTQFPGPSGSGNDILQAFQQAATSGPYQLPAIASALEAQRQQQLARNQRDLREQFSATGNRFSTDFINALTQQQTESMNNQNATLAQLIPTLSGQSLQALLASPQALTQVSQLPYQLGGLSQQLAGGDINLLGQAYGGQEAARTAADTLAGRGYQEYQRTQNLLPHLLAFLSGAPAPEYTTSPFTQGVNTATGIGSLALGAKAAK